MAYARGVGIEFPEDATFEEISALLSNYEERDQVAGAEYRTWADYFGVSYTRFTGKKALFRSILDELSKPERLLEKMQWISFRVCRHLQREADQPLVQQPDDSRLNKIAEALCTDKSAVNSAKRLNPQNPLIWFGQYTDPTGVTHAGCDLDLLVLKKSRALIEVAMDIPTTRRAAAERSVSKERYTTPTAGAPDGGHVFSLLPWIVIAGLLFGVYLLIT